MGKTKIDCKRCVHYEVCCDFTSHGAVEAVNEAMNDGEAGRCKHYLHESRVVILSEGEESK